VIVHDPWRELKKRLGHLPETGKESQGF